MLLRRTSAYSVSEQAVGEKTAYIDFCSMVIDSLEMAICITLLIGPYYITNDGKYSAIIFG